MALLYTVQLLQPVEHETAGGENLLNFNIGLTTAANTYLNSHLADARRRKLDLLRRAAGLSSGGD